MGDDPQEADVAFRLSDGHDLVGLELEARCSNERRFSSASWLLKNIGSPSHSPVQSGASVAPSVARKRPPGSQPAMDVCEEARMRIPWRMRDGVEGHDAIERTRSRTDMRGEVTVDEDGLRHVSASQVDLSAGDVDADDLESAGQPSRRRHSRPAAELEDAGAIDQPMRTVRASAPAGPPGRPDPMPGTGPPGGRSPTRRFACEGRPWRAILAWRIPCSPAASSATAAGPIERDAPIAHADVDVMADDEMVEHGHVQQPASGDRLRGQVEVIRARCRIPGRMVVDQDDARRVLPDGVAKQLADANQRRRDVPSVDRSRQPARRSSC